MAAGGSRVMEVMVLTTRGGVREGFLKVFLEGRAQGCRTGLRRPHTETRMSVGCGGTAQGLCELLVVVPGKIPWVFKPRMVG